MDLKKLKNKASLLSAIALYAFISFSFIFSPVLDSKASSLLPTDLSSAQFISSQQVIQQQSDVKDLNNELAEIRENEEDDKDEKSLHFDFAENSTYSLFSLVHQRFKSSSIYSDADNFSAVPAFILLCTYRL